MPRFATLCVNQVGMLCQRPVAVKGLLASPAIISASLRPMFGLLSCLASKRFFSAAAARSPPSNSSTIKNSSSSSLSGKSQLLQGSEVYGGEARSYRKRLKQQPVDPNLMQYLARLQIGRRRTKMKGRGQAATFHRIGPWATRIVPTGSRDLEVLFSQRFRLLAQARRTADFPKDEGVPEVAFAGRSNVGKSSLLKALSVRGAKVLVKNHPGSTNSIDFFETGNLIRFVDLPGHGFAFANQEEKELWSGLIKSYLSERKSLKRVLVLADARQGIKQGDRDLFRLCRECGVAFQVVLTKTDMVEPRDLAKRTNDIKQEMLLEGSSNQMLDRVMFVSSTSKAGIGELWKELGGLVDQSRLREMAEEVFERGRDELEPEPEGPPGRLPEGSAAGRLVNLRASLQRKPGGGKGKFGRLVETAQQILVRDGEWRRAETEAGRGVGGHQGRGREGGANGKGGGKGRKAAAGAVKPAEVGGGPEPRRSLRALALARKAEVQAMRQLAQEEKEKRDLEMSPKHKKRGAILRSRRVAREKHAVRKKAVMAARSKM